MASVSLQGLAVPCSARQPAQQVPRSIPPPVDSAYLELYEHVEKEHFTLLRVDFVDELAANPLCWTKKNPH